MDISTSEIKIFCQVMQDKSFSAAARSLKITQPTVSQQIAKLETILNGRLFERVGHSIVPTALAQEFLKFATDILERTRDFESSLLEEKNEPSGLVKYAMPESCQWTPHYKKIMGQIVKLPDVRFEISILPNDVIMQGLMEAKFDFGFIVGERLFPELRFQKFSDETYSAVAAHPKLFAPLEKLTDDGSLRLITYPGWEMFFTTWAKGHGLWNKLKSQIKEPTVHVGTLAGAIHAAENGAGIAVIPSHCVMTGLKEKTMHAWREKEKAPSHPVYLARRHGDQHSKRVQMVIELLSEAKGQH
jgi:DNA-binding transcriptional LysR family regulator